MSEVLKDQDIREALYDFLEARFGKIRIIEEKRMGRSRADLVVVTEQALVGVEIKSDADTYTRLPGQVRDYERYYDYNYVVAGSSHAMHIEEHVPEEWGIITVERADDALDFYVLRKAAPSPKLDMHKKIMILWRPELAKIQLENRLPAYTYKSKQFVRDYIADNVPSEILHRQISDALFARDYTTIHDEINAFRESHGKRKKRAPRKRGRRKF